MPLVTGANQRVFFAHVPKTGGSSVEEYLIRRFGGPLSLKDVTHRNGRRRRGLISLSTHLTAEDLLDVLPHDVDYSFAVVRNPLQRVLSQYRFQAGVSRTARYTFSTWLRLMLHCVAMDLRVYQNHIRPQSDLVPEDSEVFRLEDGFDGMIAWLDEITGTIAPEIEINHLLKKEHVPVAVKSDDVRLIHDYYAADYERFGYERESLAGYPPDRCIPLRNMAAYALAPIIVHRQRRHWLN